MSHVYSASSALAAPAFVLLAALSTAPLAGAGEIYVNPSCGNDAWSGAASGCLGPDGPKRTLTAAVNAALDGDEIRLLPGVYTGPGQEGLELQGRTLTIRGFGIGQVVLRPGGRFLLANDSTLTFLDLEADAAANLPWIATLDGTIEIERCSTRMLSTSVGLALTNTTATIRDSAFVGGIAVSAIGNGSQFPASLTHCTFEDCSLGILGTNLELEIDRCAFRACATAVRTSIGGSTLVASSTFQGQAGIGIGVRGEGVQRVSACTFEGLSLATVAPGIGGSLVIDNSIFANCLSIVAGVVGFIRIDASAVEGGWSGLGSGNTELPPFFVDVAAGDLHLRADSPLIDAGNTGLLAPGLTLDLDGGPRVEGPEVDLGAHELAAGQPVHAFCTSLPNSTGEVALMRADGPVSVARNQLLVGLVGGVPGQFVQFFYGPSPTQAPLGNGLLCVAAPQYRLLALAQIDFAGRASLWFNLSQAPAASGPGAIVGGSTWYMQGWYRDPAAGLGNSNTTNGLELVFAP